MDISQTTTTTRAPLAVLITLSIICQHASVDHIVDISEKEKKMKEKTLPEAQRTQGIESIT